MAALKGAAALCALALVSGSTHLDAAGTSVAAISQRSSRRVSRKSTSLDSTLQGKGDTEDKCPEDHKCCVPSRYMGWLDISYSEPACVKNSAIEQSFGNYACKEVGFRSLDAGLHSHWMAARKAGGRCRVGAPRIDKLEDGTWQRATATAAEAWDPGEVPLGGVGLYRDGWHWWPSVGPPCDGVADEKRGCLLYDWSWGRSMRELGLLPPQDASKERTGDIKVQPGKGVDIHWHGATAKKADFRPVLHYDQGQKAKADHWRQWPFPAFCARAAASILSLKYNPTYSQPSTAKLENVDLFFKRWAGSSQACQKVTHQKYRTAIAQTRKKRACWRFVDDWRTVMCYRFNHCRCPDDNLLACTKDARIDCCRGAFADFLTEEGLVDQYRRMIAHRHPNTLQLMFNAWDKAAMPEMKEFVKGASVRLNFPKGNLTHADMLGAYLTNNITEKKWEVTMLGAEPGCPQEYKCCAKQVPEVYILRGNGEKVFGFKSINPETGKVHLHPNGLAADHKLQGWHAVGFWGKDGTVHPMAHLNRKGYSSRNVQVAFVRSGFQKRRVNQDDNQDDSRSPVSVCFKNDGIKKACANAPKEIGGLAGQGDTWVRWDKLKAKGATECTAVSPRFKQLNADTKTWEVLPDPRQAGQRVYELGAGLPGDVGRYWTQLSSGQIARQSADLVYAVEWIEAAKKAQTRFNQTFEPKNLVPVEKVHQLDFVVASHPQKTVSIVSPSTTPVRTAMDKYCKAVGKNASQVEFVRRDPKNYFSWIPLRRSHGVKQESPRRFSPGTIAGTSDLSKAQIYVQARVGAKLTQPLNEKMDAEEIGKNQKIYTDKLAGLFLEIEDELYNVDNQDDAGGRTDWEGLG